MRFWCYVCTVSVHNGAHSMNAIQIIRNICATDMHAPQITARKHAKKCVFAQHNTHTRTHNPPTNRHNRIKIQIKIRIESMVCWDKHQIKSKVASRQCQIIFQFSHLFHQPFTCARRLNHKYNQKRIHTLFVWRAYLSKLLCVLLLCIYDTVQKI